MNMKDKYVVQKNEPGAEPTYYCMRGNKQTFTDNENFAYTFTRDEAQSIVDNWERAYDIKLEIVPLADVYKPLGKPTTKNNMTITANNYFDTMKNEFVEKLPAAAKEAHELVVAMKADGISNPFKTGDADIDGMGEALLKKANEILKKDADSTPNTGRQKAVSKSKPAAKKTKPKNTPAKPKPAKARANKPKPVRKAAPKKVSKAKAKPKTITVKKAKAKVRKVAAKAVKQARKADAAKAPVTIKKLSLELQTIKSFIGMNGKSYKAMAIVNKHKTIGNYMKEGKIHDHKSTIQDIHTRLGKAVLAIEKQGASEAKLNIEKGFIQKCQNLLSGAKVRVRTEFLSGTDAEHINDPAYISRKSDGKVWNWKKQVWENVESAEMLIDYFKGLKRAKLMSANNPNDTFTLHEYRKGAPFLSGAGARNYEVGLFMYRDGANWKTTFPLRMPEGFKKLSEGDEVTIEDMGWDVDSFFTDVIGNDYDNSIDHNTLEFRMYIDDKSESDYVLAYYPGMAGNVARPKTKTRKKLNRTR